MLGGRDWNGRVSCVGRYRLVLGFCKCPLNCTTPCGPNTGPLAGLAAPPRLSLQHSYGNANGLISRARERWPFLFWANFDSLGSSRATVMVGRWSGYPDACHHCPLFHGLSDLATSPPRADYPWSRITCFHPHLIRDWGVERPWRIVAMSGRRPVDQSATYCATPSCVAYAPVYKRVPMTVFCATTALSPPIPSLRFLHICTSAAAPIRQWPI